MPAFVVCRAGTSNRVVVPVRQAGNRFLGSLKGLQIRALKSSGYTVYLKTTHIFLMIFIVLSILNTFST